MSRPALLDKLFQAGEWVLKPGLVPIDDVTIKRNQTQIYVALDALIRQGGGLAVGSDKRIYVDFSLMPTDAFEELLKSIRVPVWLTGNKNFYVNGTTGSDVLDAGRGENASKPFKTIQAAIDYVADNYNLSNYRALINVSPGVYLEHVMLRKYNSVSGYIEIRGAANKEDVVIRRLELQHSVTYLLTSVTIRQDLAFANYYGVIATQAGELRIQNVCIDCTCVPEDSYSFTAAWTRGSGGIYVIGVNSGEIPTGLTILVNTNPKLVSGIAATSGGLYNFNADLTINGDTASTFVPISLESLSVATFVNSGANYPGRAPQVTGTGTKAGARYKIVGNSIINTNGSGPEFFPGTLPGVTGSGGQYL